MSVRHGTGCFIGKENGTVADPGEGPPLLLDQNEARRVWMTWMTGPNPPPPPLSEGLNPPLRYYMG